MAGKLKVTGEQSRVIRYLPWTHDLHKEQWSVWNHCDNQRDSAVVKAHDTQGSNPCFGSLFGPWGHEQTPLPTGLDDTS